MENEFDQKRKAEFDEQRAKEYFETCAIDWKHYQHLKTLPNFKSKLDYWRQEVCKDDLIFGTYYLNEEPAFILRLEPETDEDRRELHEFWLNWWRIKDAKENKPIDKFGYQWSQADKIKIAFRVKSIETLKADLEIRILSSTNKHHLLHRELALTSDAIDNAGRTVDGIKSIWADVINELRDSYVLNRPYDLTFSGDLDPLDKLDPLQKIIKLAKVWDIVEYEAYLKDRLAGLDNSQLNYTPDLSMPPTNDERKNSFNSMPLDEVRQWFIQLSENNSKNSKPFLTVEQVEQFIERAFHGNDSIQELTLNLADGERTSVTKLFYYYYIRCTNDYAIETTKQCKEKYVRLLTDNFTNYNFTTVFSTFNNSKSAPKQWAITV